MPWIRNRGWVVVRCLACGLLRTWPTPGSDELSALYDSPEYYADRGMEDQTAEAWVGRAHELASALGPIAGPVLDVGAGQGWLVHGFGLIGVEAVGFEPSETGRRAALGHGTPLLAELPEQGGFGAATLVHVLEHVEDPVSLLATVRELLLPGGRLLVEVPHAASIDMLRRDVRTDILDLPFHIHHFTPRTLRGVLVRSGFEPGPARRFNATRIEQLLDRRAMRSASPAQFATSAPGDAVADRATSPRLRGRAWSGTLSALRRMAPGPKLQIVARSAGHRSKM
jgi:SAM-dependent methyltransferase